MKSEESFCMLCGNDPCSGCSTSPSRRKRLTPKSALEVVTHQPAVIAEVESKTSRVARAPKENSNDPDTEFLSAVRVIAHMVIDDSLFPFKDDLLPTDYLAPEDRIADWRRRCGVRNGPSS